MARPSRYGLFGHGKNCTARYRSMQMTRRTQKANLRLPMKHDKDAPNPAPPRRWLNDKTDQKKDRFFSELKLVVAMVAGCGLLVLIAVNMWGLRDALARLLEVIVKLFV